MKNLYRTLKDLLGEKNLEVGTVTAICDQVRIVTLPGGGTRNVRGTASIGQAVYIRGDVIEGEAPDLPDDEIEI